MDLPLGPWLGRELGPLAEAVLSELGQLGISSVGEFALADDASLEAVARLRDIELGVTLLDAARDRARAALPAPWPEAQRPRLDRPMWPAATNFSSAVLFVPGRLWIEELALGRPLGAAHISQALFEVFREKSILDRYNSNLASDSRRRLFSFRERCDASGCHDIAAPDLDETAYGAAPRPLTKPRIVLGGLGGGVRPATVEAALAIRPRADLAKEAR
jgi:hypothetical protein